MPLEDYGALIRSGMSLVPDFAASQAAQVGLETEKLRQRLAAVQILGEQSKQNRQQLFQQDLTAAMQKPDATSISGLIMKYPEFAEQLKSGWDVKDKAAKDADLTHLSELYSAGSAGNWDLVKKSAHARYDAEKAAGQADQGDDAFIQSIDAAADGDEAQRKAVLGTIGTHLAAVTGPEHFGTVYGALKGGYTLGPGEVRLDDNGQVIGHSPLVKADDGGLYDWNSVMGGKTSPNGAPAGAAAPPSAAPNVQAVASTFAATGMPSPVIAGFLGNFHAEGGYDGAQGDGGSASGIAQWRGDRAAKFEEIIGKPPTQASAADQAKFVLWEMQNPEAAGMTTKQRDAIMSAKTPSQAAALIDQFYERSSGRDRNVRVDAANAFASGVAQNDHPASGGLKPLLPGKPREAPSGFRWSADGATLEKIPGGPADKSTAQFRILSPSEAQAQGLDPNTKFQMNTETGQVTAIGGQSKQAKQIPQQVLTKVQPAIDVRDTMARLAGTWKDSFGGHQVLGDTLPAAERTFGGWSGAPEGIGDWWADFKSMDNLVRNQLFGSALTEHEKQAYAATTITPRMSSEQIKKNFNRRRNIINAVTARQQNFLKKNGYDPEAVDAMFAPLGSGESGAPKTVVRTGIQKSTGKKVVQYSDGSVEVQ